MRKRIIDWIFTLQSQRGILGEKERRLYTYAYGLLLNKIAIYAIIAIVGTITGNWIGMFSFLLPFTILRQYAGGIHLEKPMNCIIFSGFLVFGCGQYLAVASDIGKILCALWVAAILLIFVLAPIDTKGKKLDKTAKKIYGRRARGVLVIEVMIAICFWVCGFIVVTKGIAIAHIILMVTVKPLTFRMEKSANYPYHLLRMIYSFYIYAGTASFGGSHPNAFNFFKYAWIFRSALN